MITQITEAGALFYGNFNEGEKGRTLFVTFESHITILVVILRERVKDGVKGRGKGMRKGREYCDDRIVAKEFRLSDTLGPSEGNIGPSCRRTIHFRHIAFLFLAALVFVNGLDFDEGVAGLGVERVNEIGVVDHPSTA
jgi:hypothetical protein